MPNAVFCECAVFNKFVADVLIDKVREPSEFSVSVLSAKSKKAAGISESLQRLSGIPEAFYKKTLIRFGALESNHVICSLSFFLCDTDISNCRVWAPPLVQKTQSINLRVTFRDLTIQCTDFLEVLLHKPSLIHSGGRL